MTAQTFWGKFKDIFKDENKKAIAIEQWYSSKDYTDFILEKIGNFLKKQFQLSKEYYRIDLTGWKQLRKSKNDKILLNNFEKHLWDLEVAVEHENSSISWMDEVVKLLHINCPLRVVIGYLPLNQKDKQENYLKAITEQILTTKAVSNCSLQKGEFMIIIGDSKCDGDKTKFCHYTAYTFDKNVSQFTKIGEF